VWSRRHTFSWGITTVHQLEEYYLVRVRARFDPRFLDEVEVQGIEELRWWPLDDLLDAVGAFAPAELFDLVRREIAPDRET
jgi:hypothetical protein